MCMHSFQPEPRHQGGRTRLAADTGLIPLEELPPAPPGPPGPCPRPPSPRGTRSGRAEGRMGTRVAAVPETSPGGAAAPRC